MTPLGWALLGAGVAGAGALLLTGGDKSQQSASPKLKLKIDTKFLGPVLELGTPTKKLVRLVELASAETANASVSSMQAHVLASKGDRAGLWALLWHDIAWGMRATTAQRWKDVRLVVQSALDYDLRLPPREAVIRFVHRFEAIHQQFNHWHADIKPEDFRGQFHRAIEASGMRLAKAGNRWLLLGPGNAPQLAAELAGMIFAQVVGITLYWSKRPAPGG